MVEPEDFGLSTLATVARVAQPVRAPRHAAFWKMWADAVWADTPRLVGREEPDPGDPTASHEFTSARHVRIGAALALPSGQPQAGLVALHGYENVGLLEESLKRWEPLTSRGIAVLCLRVRGYRGSQLDVPGLVQHAGSGGGGHWITHGLDVPITESGYGCEWSFSYAVADVVNACRALRALLERRGSNLPIFMHGESFGGALAIIAAAQLAERQPAEAPARLAIGLPSMGDWVWRLQQPPALCRGIGGIIRQFLMQQKLHLERIVLTLRTFDTVVHARRTRCPVLCKLAMRDDIVPAPTAAAVFNALAADPGCKRRFVTRYGHFDGGIGDLRRHAQFERLVDQFFDPTLSPAEALIPRSADPAHAPSDAP